MLWPGRAAQAAGIDVKIADPDIGSAAEHLHASLAIHANGYRQVLQVEKPNADLVVFQRSMNIEVLEAIPKIQAHGVRVAIEIDDDFDSISRRNQAWAATDPGKNPWSNRYWITESCKIADLVIVSTPALKERYGRWGKCVVVPNYIPERYLSVEPERTWGTFRIGWSGSLRTHPDDLKVMGGSISRVLREMDSIFYVVGEESAKLARELGTHPEKVDMHPWVPIDEYPHALAHMDLGVVPLELTGFNEAKSWLKGIELASVGVPFVASPTGPYRELASMGVGEIAVTRGDWYAKVKRYVTDPEYTNDVGLAWRDKMKEFTIERNIHRWVEAWTEALS